MASVISQTQGQRLNQAVEDLMVQAEAEAVLLMDTGGNVISHTPYRDDSLIQTIAALGAGSFSATRELAVMTEETAFSSVVHEGETTSTYIQSLPYDCLLVVIFRKQTTLGLVKLYAQKSAGELKPLLKQVTGQSVVAADGTVCFELDTSRTVFDTAGRQAVAR
jgi:predicted regulator of Ras-like GTPase activity (Roadblock/LC7/MglB family)